MSLCFNLPSCGVICYAATVTRTVAWLVILVFVCVCWGGCFWGKAVYQSDQEFNFEHSPEIYASWYIKYAVGCEFGT